jgi:hypothetical protein
MYTFQILKKITTEKQAFNIDLKGVDRVKTYIRDNNLNFRIKRMKINDRQFILSRVPKGSK